MVEQTRVATSQGHTAPAAQAARSKAPASAGAQATPDEAAGGAGGFLSLLSALGSDMDAPLLAADGAPPPAPDAGILVALLGANGADGAIGTPGQGGVPSALTPAASTLSLAGAGASGGAGVLGGVATALGAEVLPSGGLVAQTALLDNALETPALEGASTMGGYRRAFSRMQGALSSSLAGVSTTALAASQRGAAGDKSLSPASLAAASALQAMPERRDAPALAIAVPRAAPEAPAAQALVPLAMAASGPEMPVLARTSEGGTALGAVPEAWGNASYGPEGTPLTDAASALAEPSQAGAEDALAEQVAYWVSENLQNAELTVTHEGKPVEVSVSMSGKEAHIVFGSDQSETRDLLDASMAQLRDLLHSQGLILSGVTVGGSGARNTPSEGGDTSGGRQGARQAQVPVGETGAVRQSILTDRAVDVFV